MAPPDPPPTSRWGDDQLAAHLAAVLGVSSIDGLARLSGGASRETWRFVAGGRACIVQRQRAGDVRDMGVEARALRAAAAAGAPVAEVLAAGTDPSGSEFVVSAAVPGETIARKILRDDAYARARTALPAQLGEALARIHQVDPGTVEGLPGSDQLTQYREILDASGQPHPTFELAFTWLHDHRPASTRRTLVHGDFRLGNIIVDADGLAAVLDWELAHAGDPMEDLGWLCVRAWRFGASPPVAGVGRYEDLFAAYEAAGGEPIDPEVVHWWEVFGTLKWGVICIMQADVHLSGTVRSHELAAIGRRVCENEYDLFLALEGRW
jgi:aminoglycoside phosphotransferase (APT) family kinase protein